jgi:hypothetical protein
MRGTHANFRDPVGLALRMLRSRDRAAYAALVRAGSAAALTPLDRLLARFEARRLRAAGPPTKPLVLIVGAPRSGTTLLYQVLAHYLPVTYPTNLSALFPRAPITASRLFRPRATAVTTHSYYGNTAGLGGPNDGFHLWNRWLGADRYRAVETLTGAAADAMRRFFGAWTAAFGRPFLNKNNRNADCIALLGRALPEARFVVVRRDPVYVAQSLLIARQQIQGDKSRKWGLRSLDQEADQGPLGYVDSVCLQIADIERRMAEGCRTLAPERVVPVQYERFCEQPAAAIAAIAERTLGAGIETGGIDRELDLRGRSTNQRRISVEEFEHIGRSLARLGVSSS